MSTIAKLLVGLGLSSEEFVEGLERAEGKARTSAASIGQSLLKGAGTLAVAGLAAGATAVTGAVVGGVKAVDDWAGTLDGIGDVLGTTADESAALAVAIEGVGGNVDGITSQMTFMTRGLVDADGKLGPVGKTLDGLGVSFLDAQGNMLPTVDIISAVADQFATMPDGLEKTALMTEVFGKSGKDLGDTLNALANGGLDEAGVKAEALGLLIGDEMVGTMIEAGKQTATLKMAARGLFVTIGAQLIPVLAPLLAQFTAWAVSVMPLVRQGIADLSTWVQGVLVPALTRLLETMRPVIDFLIANWQPIVAAVAAAIMAVVVPALIAWAASAWAAAVATITALAPVIAVVAAIALAVGLLVAAWQNDWGGIRTTLTEVWENSLKPALQQLWDWLSVNVPAAIQVLSDFWSGTLLPAITAVWAFVQDDLIPLFEAVAELFNAALTLALTALAGLWENVLLPAITSVAKYVGETLQPVFEALSEYWETTLGPAVQTVMDNVFSKMPGIFESIREKIQFVIDKIESLTAKLKGFKLPDVLTPGSPTPFELGLRGIADAMDEVAQQAMPGFSARVRMPELDGARAGGGTVVNNYRTYQLTGNYRYESEETLSAQVRKMEMLHG